MSGKLIFGLMASVIMTCAWGASSTVTSRDYVDNALATKQVKIPSAGTAGATAGETVITYTASNGQIGERALFTGGTYDSSTDADKLITASALNGAVSNIPTTETSKLTCTDGNCLLWNIVTQTAYGIAPVDLMTLIGASSAGTDYAARSNSGVDRNGNASTYNLSSSDHNSFAVDYGSGGVIRGHGRCSTREGTNPLSNGTYETISTNFTDTLMDEAGQSGAFNCYCGLDSYTSLNGTATVLSGPWVFDNDMDGYVDQCEWACADNCAYHLMDGNAWTLAFRAAVFNSVQ